MCLFVHFFCTDEQIKRWYLSFRTDYGKIKVDYENDPEADLELTAKKQFTWDNGKFLHNSYYHRGTTVSGFGSGVSTCIFSFLFFY